MSNKSVTDLSYLREIAMGDDSIVIETTEAFLEDAPAAIENIQKHYESEEWQKLYKKAHKIKPNLKYMGMERAHELILTIEEQANTGEISEDLGEKVSEFCSLCHQALDELSDKIEALRA
ncbi:Hpt domain-containing protein [Fodinibius sp.]|uniref:Hpt domain-containing protein n=1 Tax=Fodinibius sp. TaxID=1872440 RepID=UPI002ACDEFE7|nr:Hpt domain-containing protein [Fodinibius sp.]MDZ7658268.1 Hpt domain-containing protein [Fodinibius sp.]